MDSADSQTVNSALCLGLGVDEGEAVRGNEKKKAWKKDSNMPKYKIPTHFKAKNLKLESLKVSKFVKL